MLAKPANTLLLDLRTNKTEGQANFVNPGTLLINAGLEAELTPKLRAQFNANYIRFVDTAPIRDILQTNQADAELGYDLSLGFTYRPTLTQNIIINAGIGVLLPGKGYRDIYRSITDPVPGFSLPIRQQRQRRIQRHCRDHADVLSAGSSPLLSTWP